MSTIILLKFNRIASFDVWENATPTVTSSVDHARTLPPVEAASCDEEEGNRVHRSVLEVENGDHRLGQYLSVVEGLLSRLSLVDAHLVHPTRLANVHHPRLLAPIPALPAAAQRKILPRDLGCR